ncbi:MAG: BON domain-containing protein [Acidobacteriota bacterium]
MNIKSKIRFMALPVLGFMLTATTAMRAQGSNDARIQAEAQRALDKKDFSNVQVHVRDGVITLTGDVDRVSVRDEADKKMHKLRDAAGVNDMIRVGARYENVSDQQLFDKLSKKLVYDRVGYGTTAFNDITLKVNNGVVTIGGTVYGPTDKDSAMGVVKNTAGVRGVVDELKVAPLSPMDDRIRRAEFRAIYGAPSLNKYAMDPAKPIRITVVNGHVTLSGFVDNEMDKNIANIRANGVSGVFSVTNNLQVQGQRAER